ncbi:MAG: hypothetical protein OXN97_06720 [Bryobacterales bacterium]|nr:hypothetical protein [Bryobacterales bacterium]
MENRMTMKLLALAAGTVLFVVGLLFIWPADTRYCDDEWRDWALERIRMETAMHDMLLSNDQYVLERMLRAANNESAPLVNPLDSAMATWRTARRQAGNREMALRNCLFGIDRRWDPENDLE